MLLTSSSRNIGYARAQNRNLRRARGAAVLLLNQDVVLAEDFLEKASAVLMAHPEVGAVQGRLRRLEADGTRSATLDSTGLVMHRDRRAAIRDHLCDDAPRARRDMAGPIWGVDGPAPLYRAEALASARLPARRGGSEVLDEDFFMYKEDVDLAWRLRRLGWQAWCEPEALGWHARTEGGPADRSARVVASASLAHSARVRRLSYRNQRLMQVKNDPLRQVLRDLPAIVLREVAELGYVLVRDPRRLSVMPSLWRSLPGALRKRRALERAIASPSRPVGRSGLSS